MLWVYKIKITPKKIILKKCFFLGSAISASFSPGASPSPWDFLGAGALGRSSWIGGGWKKWWKKGWRGAFMAALNASWKRCQGTASSQALPEREWRQERPPRAATFPFLSFVSSRGDQDCMKSVLSVASHKRKTQSRERSQKIQDCSAKGLNGKRSRCHPSPWKTGSLFAQYFFPFFPLFLFGFCLCSEQPNELMV